MRHSRSGAPLGAYLVRLYRGVTRVRLEVTDAGGPGTPVVRRSAAAADLADPAAEHDWDALLGESGSGLALVEHFAARWGTRGDARGRAVFADLDTGPLP